MHHISNFIYSIKPFILVVLSITIANINTYLQSIGLIISIGYGIRKFYILEREEKDKNKINKK